MAFKGGSEHGVLTFATRTLRDDGQVACTVASWNDAEHDVEMQRLAAPYSSILATLAQQ